jgi:hypothetical protein
MKTQSPLTICCHDDESTTNQISRSIRPISTCDTLKTFPMRLERITDATVPIGTNLDLCQACCEDGKGNSETAPMLTRNTVSQPISPGFGQWNIRIASP